MSAKTSFSWILEHRDCQDAIKFVETLKDVQCTFVRNNDPAEDDRKQHMFIQNQITNNHRVAKAIMSDVWTRFTKFRDCCFHV